ncbi:MAG: hypothetical protein AC479_01445 [miscellaneous Crenarchaeota group-6 archaeon AD8-1]|nr:MAG: hypothetical protein AC479_01445 [miscellaneous Crenarchaeota group-6 archaeon AD8-1]
MTSKYASWDKIYRDNPLHTLGWELGRLRLVLVELLKKNIIQKGKILDICCGAGKNSIYLAKKVFSVIAINISLTAIGYAKKNKK